MTLSLHKLWAGSGYEYLTRQVAALDASHRRGSLASYYSERGEAPGRWVGAGLSGLYGMRVGDVVTAGQMRALFGFGLHPLAAEREEAARRAGLSEREVVQAGRLGTPFRPASAASPLLVEADRRLAVSASSDITDSAAAGEIRPALVSEVAAEWFERDHGRQPRDARELAGAVARLTRPGAQPVAGFDLTFSPVKSVSALWAVAEPAVAAEIECAHDAAVADALAMIEQRALFTREGTNGVRQVEVRGLVATSFTHRDSRAGDPDLHTHVAVANKVQTLDGRWLAIDGRMLYAATVTASEMYNTALEQHLGERLGLRFADRPPPTGKRPVRELVGVDPSLSGRWSSRRHAIDARRAELARQFHTRAGRPPTREEAWRLAQQATLQTRTRKHEPRTIAEQRAVWRSQADEVLGSREAVTAMVTATLKPDRHLGSQLDISRVAEWVAATAARVVATVEEDRATWQQWHLRSEALRQVRNIEVPSGMTGHLVDLVVDEAINQSVAVTNSADPSLIMPAGLPREPSLLRRSDGTSVYTVAGTEGYTSHRILAAEQRILQSAALVDGQRLDRAAVDVALAKAALAGGPLNEGQAALVRALATSGRRVQLALSPAGTGKTTALRVLASAWTEAGGTVAGLAPSAAAARILGEQLNTPTETLAKLAFSLDHPNQPASAGLPPTGLPPINKGTLLLIDEAGLANTSPLDTVIGYVLNRGGSVRMIGDDRQLGAVGAGGILRDLDAEHGSVRLTDVVRFADPAEAAASLALRVGRLDALGFYLDQNRVHVGDPTTTLDQVFTAWTADRAAGLDTLMLAPTRDLVAELNTRAQQHQLDRHDPRDSHDARDQHDPLDQSRYGARNVGAPLADGNTASRGDLILCRANDRRLRSSRGQWVRNGDRFLVERVHPDGSLTVRSLLKAGTGSARRKIGKHNRGTAGTASVVLPVGYVTASVQLGYASTVHAAQGLTCDTVHGVVAGDEGRAQLYTLLTRGRVSNHLYLQIGEDQGMHDLARPGEPPPATPVELLERILARDDTARSATSLRADATDPARVLTDAVARYTDALHLAADHTTTNAVKQQLTSLADHLLPGITDEPAWPTLCSHLLLAAVDDDDPGRPLKLAVAASPFTDAHDRAAVLHRRLTDRTTAAGGPLPWLTPLPSRLQQDATWGPHLTAYADLITGLVQQVLQRASGEKPAWAAQLPPLSPGLTRDIAVWRAATGVARDDPRPTGAVQTSEPMRRWQHRLDSHLQADSHNSQLQQVATILMSSARKPRRDADFERVVRQLTHLARQGVAIDQPLRNAIDENPLPDDHRYAALWWRLHRHLPADLLATRPTPAASISTSTYTSQLLEPHPDGTSAATDDTRLDTALMVEGMRRLLITAARPEQPTTHHPEVPAESASDVTSYVTRNRIRDINRETLSFYRARLEGSWAASYLTDRCRSDLAADDRFQPGYAPHGWTHLVDHLRRLGATDSEMIAAGVASVSSRHQLIDRFRDRLILPILTNQRDIVGFVGRRHPGRNDQSGGGPKYLNSPTTALFIKRNQLYGGNLLTPPTAPCPADRSIPDPALSPLVAPAVPVLVEGPLDAVAVTLAGNGRYIGVATLGTAFSPAQAAQVATQRIDPIIATDPDIAGRAAAQRAYWLLTRHGLDPRGAALDDGFDPAATLQQHGPHSLRHTLEHAGRLGDRLILDLADAKSASSPTAEALRILAARPPHTWAHKLGSLGTRAEVNDNDLRRQLLTLVQQRTREITRLPVETGHEVQPTTRRAPPLAADLLQPITPPAETPHSANRPITRRSQESLSPPPMRI